MTWVPTPNRELANILASHSLNPDALRAHVALYRTVMFGESGLSRLEREAVAVAVSAVNDCHYWVVHHSAEVVREGGDAALTEAVASADLDSLPPRLRALCAYAYKLTAEPWAVREGDLEPLRAAGLTDRDIVDANQVVSYFNYVNRVADGLGVELEDHWPAEVRPPRRYGAHRGGA